MNQEKLEQKIEDIDDLHEKTEDEIEKVVAAFSQDGMELRRARKKIRYQLYRLKGEALGTGRSVSEEGFKEQFESDPNFGGWKFFGITWDVAFEDPYRCVHRDKSINEEWDELVAAKFPTIAPGGKIIYPDIKVRKAVEAETELQKKDNE